MREDAAEHGAARQAAAPDELTDVAYFHWGAKRNGNELSHFKSQCRKGTNPWRTCFPGKTYRNLRSGYHTVRIRTGDAQGWDRTPVKYRWFVRSSGLDAGRAAVQRTRGARRARAAPAG